MDEVRKEVSMGMVAKIAKEIKIGSFGLYAINNNQSNGYNIVKWECIPYTARNNIKKIKERELIINASILATVVNRINLYTRTTENTIVQLRHVVHPDMNMGKKSEIGEYPSQY